MSDPLKYKYLAGADDLGEFSDWPPDGVDEVDYCRAANSEGVGCSIQSEHEGTKHRFDRVMRDVPMSEEAMRASWEAAFEQHLLALAQECVKRMECDPDFCGGIKMDCKRPFGNSMRRCVAEDTLRVVGIEWESSSDEEDEELEVYSDRLWAALPAFLRDRVKLVLK